MAGIEIPLIQQTAKTAPIGAPQMSNRIGEVGNPYVESTGMGEMGKAIQNVAAVAKQRADTTTLINAQGALDQWETENLYGPQGAYTKKGKDAMGVPEEYGAKFNSDMENIRKNLQGADVVQKFDMMAQSRYGTINNQLHRYTRNELDTYSADSTKATIESGVSRAEDNAYNPNIYESAINGSAAAYKAWAQTQGKPPEEINNEVRKIQEDGYYRVMGKQAINNPDELLNKISWGRDPSNLKNDANAPRGIRNNNPGNLMGEDAWQGKTGADSGGYVQFDTPQNGLRAMATNLKNQDKLHGLNTVRDIISKYAPKSENDTKAYIGDVSKQMGVNPDDKLNLDDQKQLTTMMGAMIKHENNGQQPYSPKLVNEAAGVIPTDPTEAIKTGYKPFDSLGFDKQAQIIGFAESNQRRMQMHYRADVERQEKDSLAGAEYGKPGQQLTVNDYVKAYGPDEGQIRYKTYADSYTLAQNVNNIATQTPEQQAITLKASEPKAGEADFANKQQGYNQLLAAVNKTNDLRNNDPISFAQGRSLISNQPLQFSNPRMLDQQLKERQTFIDQFSKTYGSKVQLLTKDEATLFAQGLEKQTPEMKLGIMKKFRDGLDVKYYQSLVQQIRPDSPVTAMAGMYLGLDKQMTVDGGLWKDDTLVPASTVAMRLMQGEDLLNPMKAESKENGKGKVFPMPSDGKTDDGKGLRDYFDRYVGNALAGQPEAYSQAYQAYRAFYAGEASNRGIYKDSAPDEAVADLAVKAVIGNVAGDDNKVIVPWGMSESAFRDLGAKALYTAVKDAGGNPNLMGWNDVDLQNTGDANTFLVKSGNGYALDKNGRALTVKIGK